MGGDKVVHQPLFNGGFPPLKLIAICTSRFGTFPLESKVWTAVLSFCDYLEAIWHSTPFRTLPSLNCACRRFALQVQCPTFHEHSPMEYSSLERSNSFNFSLSLSSQVASAMLCCRELAIGQIFGKRTLRRCTALVGPNRCWLGTSLCCARSWHAFTRPSKSASILKWPWGITNGSILGWMNIHLPPILMFTRGK